MECPHCTATLPDDDIFCEECGERLAVEAPAAPADTRCSCGAGPDDVDEDGFCLQCGKRVRPRPEDHIEIVLSPQFAAVVDRGLRHERNEDRAALRCGTGASACANQSKRGEAGQDVFNGAAVSKVALQEAFFYSAQAEAPVPHGDGALAEAESLCHRFVIVVCDGVSNSHDSHMASCAAADTIADVLEHGDDQDPERLMSDAIAQAADRVAHLAPEDSDDAPSTTAVAVLIERSRATIGWVGDSRAYWIDADGARQLTSDHSWMNEVVSSGEMTVEEAAANPKAHGITRWLGGDSGENAKPDIIHFELPGPGALLLCTDGLWNYAPGDEMIADLVRGAEGDALAICRKLVAFANAEGGHDNITAALLRFES